MLVLFETCKVPPRSRFSTGHSISDDWCQRRKHNGSLVRVSRFISQWALLRGRSSGLLDHCVKFVPPGFSPAQWDLCEPVPRSLLHSKQSLHANGIHEEQNRPAPGMLRTRSASHGVQSYISCLLSNRFQRRSETPVNSTLKRKTLGRFV